MSPLMASRVFQAGVVSVVALLASQLIRFAGNVFLARLLAPEAFGVVAIVTMVLIGIHMFSDLALRQIAIQRTAELTAEFLNTLWTIQLLRGLAVGVVVLLLAGLTAFLQNTNTLQGNAYADPLLPYLIAAASLNAILGSLDSTRLYTAYRTLALTRVAAIELLAQVGAMALMIAVAWFTASAWALMLGAMANVVLRMLMSHSLLPGLRNRIYLDRALAREILDKGRWALLSSPLSFLEFNGVILMLGVLLNSTALGVFMIAFQLAGVVQMVAQNLGSNVFFPRLSAAVKQGTPSLQRSYQNLQLASDALIVTAAGALIACGPALVAMLFDERYRQSGQLLSWLALGLFANRYFVVEQLMVAQGDFRKSPPVILARVCGIAIGVFAGFDLGGAEGAAIGIGLSGLAAWPQLLWYRAKTIAWCWWLEAAALGFLAVGYGLGLVLAFVIESLQLQLRH